MKSRFPVLAAMLMGVGGWANYRPHFAPSPDIVVDRLWLSGVPRRKYSGPVRSASAAAQSEAMARAEEKRSRKSAVLMRNHARCQSGQARAFCRLVAGGVSGAKVAA